MKQMKIFLFILILNLLSGCNSKDEKYNISNKASFIEIASFSIREGVSEPSLLKAFDDVQYHFMNNQDGMVKRQLAKKFDSEFVEIIYWKSKLEADKAYGNFYKNAVCLSYIKLLQVSKDTVASVKRLQIIQEHLPR